MATTILGLARFKRRLARIPIEARREIKTAIRKEAEELAAEQRRLVPVVDGDLQASIRTEELSEARGRFGYAVKAGDAKAPHARWLEFGTTRMWASPFFFPPYRARRQLIRRRLRAAVRKAARAQVT